MNEKLITEIKRHGKAARGKKELINHLEGKRLTPKKAIEAKCFDCLCYMVDGRQDCKIPKCPCYPFMAYSADKKKRKAARVE